MDIEEFYDADARRRPSAEIELGRDWHDAHGVAYELNFVVDTGELYIMQEPPPHEWIDPFGGVYVALQPGYGESLGVRVVAQIDSVDTLHKILEGWQDAMQADGGAEWLAARLRAAGVLIGADPIPDSGVEVDPIDE